jgi:deoxyribose-phosphate aldolase
MHLTEAKRAEALLAIQMGAEEIDAVLNLAAYFSRDEAYMRAELESLVRLTEGQGALLKVILETAYLNEPDIITLCQWCSEAGVSYVKTSTGFAPKGAEIETVRLMRQVLPSQVKIKASGGIRTAEAAWAFIEAGADRIGTSTAL